MHIYKIHECNANGEQKRNKNKTTTYSGSDSGSSMRKTQSNGKKIYI